MTAASHLRRTLSLVTLALFTFTSILVARAQAPSGELGAPPLPAATPAPLPVASPLLARVDVLVYLPLVRGPVAPPPAPTCAPSAEEAAIADLMRSHPDQQRPALTCHPILAQVARARAEDMRDRDYFGHVNPDGYGPNYLVTAAGYVLPDYYSSAPDANNIESIAAGYTTPAAAWEAWMNSDQHRTHLLGEVDFYARQVEYGIGYARGGHYGHYWVVITAEPGP